MRHGIQRRVTMVVNRSQLLEQRMLRFFDWFQIGALMCLMCLGVTRGAVLYARGVPVVAIDRQRSLGRVFADLFFALCFLFWVVEVVAYSVPVPILMAPQPLGQEVSNAVPFKAVGCAATLAGLSIY